MCCDTLSDHIYQPLIERHDHGTTVLHVQCTYPFCVYTYILMCGVPPYIHTCTRLHKWGMWRFFLIVFLVLDSQSPYSLNALLVYSIGYILRLSKSLLHVCNWLLPWQCVCIHLNCTYFLSSNGDTGTYDNSTGLSHKPPAVNLTHPETLPCCPFSQSILHMLHYKCFYANMMQVFSLPIYTYMYSMEIYWL